MKNLEQALQEISEITVINGNYKEAFEIIQSIVDRSRFKRNREVVMRIIENNFKQNNAKPLTHTCRWCKSIFEYVKTDISNGNLFLSQQEQYSNIEGLICPACNQFDNLNNGY